MKIVNRMESWNIIVRLAMMSSNFEKVVEFLYDCIQLILESYCEANDDIFQI